MLCFLDFFLTERNADTTALYRINTSYCAIMGIYTPLGALK